VQRPALRPETLDRLRRTRMGLWRRSADARSTAIVVVVAVLGGVAAAGFARACDAAMALHEHLLASNRWATLALLPLGFAAAAWATRRFAPAAAGSGIPQVIAAAETRWNRRRGGRRVSLATAAWKVVLSAGLLACGASIGREGPTVQVVAGIMRTLTRGLRRPGRRAVIVAGGAAGVAAAFNTPIAGVVFAAEELTGGFDRRTQTTVILVVVAAGFTSYAIQGDYAYFGQLSGDPLGSAWLAAPVIGVVGGLAGGLFARALAELIGPADHPVARLRRARPVAFAALCGLVAVGAALASGGLTYGVGYAEAKSLLVDHPAGRGLSLAFWKAVASLAAAASGAPGGIFAPSLAIGAGLGAALAKAGLWVGGRAAVVLGMASYLSGVVQAPLTSAVILMEMTRDPGLVGPLMLAALTARWVSGWVMPEPLYHRLSLGWRPPSHAPPDVSTAVVGRALAND